MGNKLSLFGDHSSDGVGQRRNKRKASDDFESEIQHTHKKKKLTTTSQYIYKTLFQEGLNSDVTIVALGTEWKLHKIYLCQSRYFNSMFSGSWKEVNEPLVHVGIEDRNITIDALRVVFGSLYQDEIMVDSSDVVSIIAAATLFQLDGLIEQCVEVMVESINMQSVLKFAEVSEEYGLAVLKQKTFEWLLTNLTVKVNESIYCLKAISERLMEELMASSKLVVVQTEFSLYILLKMWIFLRQNPIWEGEIKDCITQAHNYFQEKMKEGELDIESHSNKSTCYLESNEGLKYCLVFRQIRLQHLVMHHLDVEQLESDRILPTDWFQPIFRDHWFRMLRVNQGVDKGPRQVNDSEFDAQCVRCGRILMTDSQHIWLWTGYQFGQDLIVSCSSRTFTLRRAQRAATNFEGNNNSGNANNLSKRHLMFRFNIYSLNSEGQTTYTVTSGLKSVTLSKNEELKVLSLDKDAKFPILVSANFLMTTPLHSIPKDLKTLVMS